MEKDELRVAMEKLCCDLVDKGQLIEAGWLGFKLLTIPKDASDVQVDNLRSAFFAGAQNLFSSVIGVMSLGEEPGEKDMQRMDSIEKELRAFIVDFEKRYMRRN